MGFSRRAQLAIIIVWTTETFLLRRFWHQTFCDIGFELLLVQNFCSFQTCSVTVEKFHFFCNGIFHYFSISEKYFQFSSWNHFITEQAKGKPCKKMSDTWKLKILRANWNVKLKFPGMEHGFLSQNKIYYILKTKRANQISES